MSDSPWSAAVQIGPDGTPLLTPLLAPKPLPQPERPSETHAEHGPRPWLVAVTGAAAAVTLASGIWYVEDVRRANQKYAEHLEAAPTELDSTRSDVEAARDRRDVVRGVFLIGGVVTLGLGVALGIDWAARDSAANTDERRTANPQSGAAFGVDLGAHGAGVSLSGRLF